MIVVLTAHVVVSNQITGFDRRYLCWKQANLAQDKCTLQLCCEPRRGLRLFRSLERSSAGEANDGIADTPDFVEIDRNWSDGARRLNGGE